MSHSSVHERMTLHAFHDYDSGFGVFFNIFLFLLTIQFKGKKVQILHLLAHSRSFMICFQVAVLFFSYENDEPPECLSIGQYFLNIYFFYIQYFQWKGCINCFWARKYFFLMHSALTFECLSLCILYLWKCVLVFATKSFGLLVWIFFPVCGHC